MEIGGEDIVFECEMTPARLRKVLSTIRCWWPGAVFALADAGVLKTKTQVEVPSEILAYKTQLVFDLIRKHGVTGELQDEVLMVMAQPEATTFVVGKFGGETDLIRQDIEQMIQEEEGLVVA